MNKKEFLEELGTYLAILEDREQQDILEEYAQHIDMKTGSGLSEEEAIRDFGDIRELAGEILEAYHVKPEYQGPGTGKHKIHIQRTTARGKQLWDTVKHFFYQAGASISTFFTFCYRKIKQGAGCVWRFLSRPWKERISERRRDELAGAEYGDELFMDGEKRAEDPSSCQQTADRHYTKRPHVERRAGRFTKRTGGDRMHGTPGIQSSDGADEGQKYNRDYEQNYGIGSSHRSFGYGFRTWIGRVFCSFTRLIGQLIRIAILVVLWCVRWCFNGCMIMLGLFSGFATLCAIFLFGMSAVWLSQGYPLMGVTVVGLGAILCGVSFTYLCFSLLKLKRGQGKQNGVNKWNGVNEQKALPEQQSNSDQELSEVITSREVRHA